MLQMALREGHAEAMDEEQKELFSRLYVPLQFAADLRSGMFTMTAQEYTHLPATLVDFIRMYRQEKAIIDAPSHEHADE